jgi:hypothetical protein
MDRKFNSTIELEITLNGIAMSLLSTSLVPEYMQKVNCILSTDDYSWHEAIKNHSIHDNISVKEVPLGVKVGVNSFRQDLTQKWYVLAS